MHYVGYSVKYDEWKDCNEIEKPNLVRLQKKKTPTEKSLDDRVGAFFDMLGREIKENLQK